MKHKETLDEILDIREQMAELKLDIAVSQSGLTLKRAKAYIENGGGKHFETMALVNSSVALRNAADAVASLTRDYELLAAKADHLTHLLALTTGVPAPVNINTHPGVS